MRSNPELVKNIMKMQGMELTDDQIKMMQSTMTPELLKTMKG